MNKHTPGPWTLTHKQGSNFAVQEFEIRGMFDDKPNIMPVFNKNQFAIDGARIYVSPEDARLIAAAPDLLDSCNALLGLLQLIEKRCDPELQEIIRTNHRVGEAQAAVDKATR